MSKPELVVLDMIGTTVQTSKKIPDAFKRAFEKDGIHLSDADVSAVRGKSKRQAIHELLVNHGGEDLATRRSSSVYAEFKNLLLDCYREAPVNAIQGTPDLFSWSHNNDIRVALTTGFDRDLAELILSRLEWTTMVDALVCNDDVDAGRPAPDMILAAMRQSRCADVACVASVGDTVSDLEAGANAGTRWNIGVLSGAHTREQLSTAPHTALIDSIAELPELLSATA